MSAAKRNGRVLKESLNDLVKKFSKNDVIAEMEKEYQRAESLNIPLSLIDDNSFVKKVVLPETTVNRMAEDIEGRGLFSPLIVRPSGAHYELIIGRKRYFGAKKAGLKEVPAVVRESGDEETLLMLLADTRDQRDGDVVEMALLYDALKTRFDYSANTLAKLSHQSRSQVVNTMRILRLSDHLLAEITQGRLTYGHAKAIASLSDEEIEEVVRRIHKENLSVRETEDLARQYGSRAGVDEVAPSLGEKMKEACGAKSVVVRRTSLSILFDSEEERDEFIKKMIGE
jgi:ParB family chromosome partitioning protein